MPNPFLTRDEKKAKQSKGFWRSKNQEKTVAKKFGGRVVGGGVSRKSTARFRGKVHKGDVQIVNIARIECKTTQADSFRVTKEMIDKITNAGVGSGELPAIVIEFLDNLGKPEQEVAVIPMWALQQMIANGSQD